MMKRMMKKSSHTTPRSEVQDFQQIKNIGPALADDFRRLKLRGPQALIGKDPFELYRKICKVDGVFHDPCVLDCFISAVEFMNGKRPQDWWAFTKNRKKQYTEKIQQLRELYRG